MKKGVGMVVSGVAGTVLGAGMMKKVNKPEIDKNKELKDLADKHLALFLMMNRWVNIKQEGKNLSSYFERNGYKKIAIYGMSYAGCTLYDELLGSDIEIAYLIDQNPQRSISLGKGFGAKFVSMDDDLEEVDVIVVTPITFFDEISGNLRKKIGCPIISLDDIIDEV